MVKTPDDYAAQALRLYERASEMTEDDRKRLRNATRRGRYYAGKLQRDATQEAREYARLVASYVKTTRYRCGIYQYWNLMDEALECLERVFWWRGYARGQV